MKIHFRVQATSGEGEREVNSIQAAVEALIYDRLQFNARAVAAVNQLLSTGDRDELESIFTEAARLAGYHGVHDSGGCVLSVSVSQ